MSGELLMAIRRWYSANEELEKTHQDMDDTQENVGGFNNIQDGRSDDIAEQRHPIVLSDENLVKKFKVHMENDGFDLDKLPKDFNTEFPKKKEEMEDFIEDKEYVHLEQDIFSLTTLCMLKETEREWALDPYKRA